MLGAGVLLALIGTALWILRPLIPAILWASAIVVSTWPVLIRLERLLGGRRMLAGALLTLLLTLVLLAPLAVGIVSLVDNAPKLADWARSIQEEPLPQPPAWVGRLPLIGVRLASTWSETAAEGAQELLPRLAPYADRLVSWLLERLGGVGRMIFHLVLTVIGVVFLYRHGDTVGARVTSFARSIAGEHGVNAVTLAVQATRSVALGVLVTAILQALIAALGLLVAGVPSVGLLTVAMIVTGLAQLGPMPILLPAVAWLYWQGEPVWATVLLVWSGFVGVIDNVLRPILIRRGADLPLMLVFVGVIGGLIAFGVVGLFIGPVVLAVTYRLSEAWVEREAPGPPAAASSPFTEATESGPEAATASPAAGP